MKRVKALATVLICASLLCGCGESKENDNSKTQQTVSEVSTEELTNSEETTDTEEITEENNTEAVEEEPKTTGSTGADDVLREPEKFSATDDIFLGEWVDASDKISTLTITEDNPQTGGYYLELDFYNITSATANANIDEDGLSINQGFFDVKDSNQTRFSGYLKKTDNGISLTITESELEFIFAGTVYEYTRKSK